jgi:uncharacterized membrane protein YhaH (DUF805 family)
VAVTNTITASLRKMASFSGRASRAEFWWMLGALVLIEAILVILFEASGAFEIGVVRIGGSNVSALFAATCVALGIPFLSVSWRRLHDIGWVGWAVLVWGASMAFFLRILAIVASDLGECLESGSNKCFGEIAWGYGFTPAVTILVFTGGFALLMARPSQPQANAYGPNPHEASP